MIERALCVATSMFLLGCPRPAGEPGQIPEQGDATQPEPPRGDRIRRLELGWGIATLTESGVLEFRGPAEFSSWLAERGAIEDIWQGIGICVRTSSGTSCKRPEAEFRIEPATEAEVIDVEWSAGALCAATSDGALWCSIDPQPHTKPLQRFPVAVSGVRDVEVQGEFGCARLEDGSALCWSSGRETLGELCKQAPGTPGCEGLAADQANWPAPSDRFARTRDIAVGYEYACILGENGVPRCHDEGTHDIASLGRDFMPIEGAPPLVEIHGGLRHVCGRSEAGEVWCWGSNEVGELGDGTTEVGKAHVPVRVEGISAVEVIALAGHQSCVVVDGEVRCWGWLRDTPVDTIPTEIPGILASELSVEQTRACARVDAGWKCWGGPSNTTGGAAAASRIVDTIRDEQFGEGCRFASGRLRCNDSEQIWLDLRGVIDVTRTGDPVCALLHKRVECHASFGDEPIVIRVPASVSLQGSLDYGCVLTKTGAVHCWEEEPPAAKIELPGKQVAVSTGVDEACALDEAGSVRCWTGDQPPIVAAVSDVVELHGSQYFGCARTRAGTLSCWGPYLVADPDSPAPTPEQPATLQLPAPAVEFGLGEDYGCARLDDARVFCWGSEMYGQRARLSPEIATRPRTIMMASEKP